MKAIEFHGRALRGGLRAIIAVVLVAGGAAVANAQVIFTVGTATAPPGGVAPITISLSGGNDLVATAGIDVLFDINVLSIASSDCTIAAALATTHVLATTVPAPGRVRLGIFDLSPPVEAFNDGDLATCNFHVLATAPLGISALTAKPIQAADASVPPVVLPLGTAVDGQVDVEPATPTPSETPTITATASQTPTLTPTVAPTNTPTVAPTNTPTVAPSHTPTVGASNTPTVAPSNTPTVGPTNTPTVGVSPTNTPTVGPHTPTPTPTGPTPTQTGGGGISGKNDSDGCHITPTPSSGSSSMWLLAPVALLIIRRRQRG